MPVEVPFYRLICFADTSFLYAAVDKADKWHSRAVDLLEQARERKWRVITTDLVVAETHALLVRRFASPLALEWLEWATEVLWIEYIAPGDVAAALEILRRYRDKDFTLTDAVSFVVIERLDVPVALSCDRHFVEYEGGFLTLPLEGERLPA